MLQRAFGDGTAGVLVGIVYDHAADQGMKTGLLATLETHTAICHSLYSTDRRLVVDAQIDGSERDPDAKDEVARLDSAASTEESLAAPPVTEALVASSPDNLIRSNTGSLRVLHQDVYRRLLPAINPEMSDHSSKRCRHLK